MFHIELHVQWFDNTERVTLHKLRCHNEPQEIFEDQNRDARLIAIKELQAVA